MSEFLILQPKEELDLVRCFQQHAQLVGVRMKDFAARSAETEPAIAEGLQLDLRHSVTRASAAGDTAQFDVRLQIEALGDRERNKLLFEVECCFELSYLLTTGYAPAEAELDAFKRANAVFHCWPYMREFVQSATQRMGLSVPPIPLLRIGAEPSSEPRPSRRQPAAERGPARGRRRAVNKD